MGKFGVKIFPDSDIRERIDAHRVAAEQTPKTLKAPRLKESWRR
jgi:hypothetical protein